jgi:hypothetical protein
LWFLDFFCFSKIDREFCSFEQKKDKKMIIGMKQTKVGEKSGKKKKKEQIYCFFSLTNGIIVSFC